MRQKISKHITTWENRCYINGLPDEADERLEAFGKVPSYRRICKAILKNDLSVIGIQGTYSHYYSALKKIEIDARPESKNTFKQLQLFK